MSGVEQLSPRDPLPPAQSVWRCEGRRTRPHPRRRAGRPVLQPVRLSGRTGESLRLDGEKREEDGKVMAAETERETERAAEELRYHWDPGTGRECASPCRRRESFRGGNSMSEQQFVSKLTDAAVFKQQQETRKVMEHQKIESREEKKQTKK